MRCKLFILIILLITLSCSCQNSNENKIDETDIPPLIDIEKGTKLEYKEYVPKPGEDIYFSPGYSTYSNYIVYSKQVGAKTMYGFLDLDFNVLSEPLSDNPPIFHKGLAYIIVDGKQSVINESFEKLNIDVSKPFLYDGIWLNKATLTEIIIIPGKEEKYTFAIFSGDRYGKIKTNDVLIRYKYANGLWGYKTFTDVYINNISDEDGFVIEPIYDSAGNFSEGFASVKLEDKWGYIDEKGELIIDCEYDDVNKFVQGVAFVGKIDEASPHPTMIYSLIATNGEKLTDIIITHPRNFYEGIAAVNTNEGGALIDTSGKVLHKVDFRVSCGFKNRIALVIWDDGYYFINENGENITGETYMYANEFSDGYALVFKKGKYGYINEDGLYAIEPSFKEASDFRSGYAAVRETRDSTGYIIDKLGNEYLVELDISGISTFNNEGYALAYSTDSESGQKTYYLIHSD